MAGCGKRGIQDKRSRPSDFCHIEDRPSVQALGSQSSPRGYAVNPPKNAATSPAKSSGCSIAAKWPPFGCSLKRTKLKRRSTTTRGACQGSPGKLAYAVGTSTREACGET